MRNMVKVDGYSGIVKDTQNGAVVSADRAAFFAHKARKKKQSELDARIKNLEDKIDNVESILSKILEKL